MRKLKTFVLTLTASLAATLMLSCVAEKREVRSRFEFHQQPGPYSVGFQTVHQYDESRNFGIGKRPIQTMIWYPTESTEKPMTYENYLKYRFTQFNPDALPADWRRQIKLALTENDYISEEQAEAEMSFLTWARQDAQALKGVFPLVIYAPSFNGAPSENSDLCEYLASYGYIILSSPSFGANSESMTNDLVGINTQASDINFLKDYALQNQTLLNINPNRIAVMGYSWGGMANIFAAVRDREISALICLDGSLRYFPNQAQEAGIQINSIQAPLLAFVQSPTIVSIPDDILTHFHQSNVLLLTMNTMPHWGFGSLAYRYYPDLFRQFFTIDESLSGYNWVARYTLEFLDATFKSSSKSQIFLDREPIENGVPEGIMTRDYYPRHPSD